MVIISLLLIMLSITLLRLAWRKKGLAFKVTKGCAWALVIVALALLSTTVGAEFGIAFGLMTFSITGFALVLINGDYQNSNKTASPHTSFQSTPFQNISIGNRPPINNTPDFKISDFKTPDLETSSHNSTLSYRVLQHRAALFIVTGPLALLATCLMALLMVNMMPAQLDTQMASAAFLFPCLYALTGYYLCAQQRPFKHALFLVACSGIAGAYLYL